jgi:hypothetical protein
MQAAQVEKWAETPDICGNIVSKYLDGEIKVIHIVCKSLFDNDLNSRDEPQFFCFFLRIYYLAVRNIFTQTLLWRAFPKLWGLHPPKTATCGRGDFSDFWPRDRGMAHQIGRFQIRIPVDAPT